MNQDLSHTDKGLKSLYNPVKKAEETARIVCRANQRRYYRFRPALFYGGIGTADCLGCCLRCLFCWSWDKVLRPGSFGRFYSPQQVADRLTNIAYKKGFKQVRISGNEPTLSRDHLLQVLEQIPGNILFILETNGILIGNDSTYARNLSRFENLYVRVSMKGTNETEFTRLTGAEPAGFDLQVQALENLARVNVTAHPAVMVSFSSPENIETLRRRLKEIDEDFEAFEVEERLIKVDASVKTHQQPLSVIPAKAGIQENQPLLDSRLRGIDGRGGFLRINQGWSEV